jgi:hypothetical protein
MKQRILGHRDFVALLTVLALAARTPKVQASAPKARPANKPCHDVSAALRRRATLKGGPISPATAPRRG